MWNPSDRYSFDAARSEGAASADDATLAGDDDLTLSPEELAMEDPLDEKASARLESSRRLGSSNSISALAGRVRQWVGGRPYDGYAAPTSQSHGDSEESGGLLQGGDAAPRWSTTQQTASWLVWPLPSFTHHFFVKGTGKPEVYRPTDYLDGMRGVASLFVFFDHYLTGLHDGFEQHGYGEGNHWNIFQLPFLKIIYDGGAMVAIFFIISGYVLSARCVVAMRTDNHDKLYTALTSMAFRRAMRLFVPSIAISFITFFIALMGFIQPPVKHYTFWSELHRYWMYLMEDLFKIWTWQISVKGWFGRQLWTIPVEFKCSLVLFIFILVVARCKVWVRFSVEGLALVYLYYRDRWDVALFVMGMTVAEINIIYDERKKARESDLDAGPEAPLSRWQKLARQSPLWIVFFTGWYLMGYPKEDALHTPGYNFLSTVWRVDWDYKFRFWLAIGATMMVFATSFLPAAQAVFTTRIARYLGKISYALYLVHGVMNRTVRHFLWNTFWGVLQYETEEGDNAQYEGGWILGTMIYVPLAIWGADIVWRAIDEPAVRLAKWVEGKAFKEKKH